MGDLKVTTQDFVDGVCFGIHFSQTPSHLHIFTSFLHRNCNAAQFSHTAMTTPISLLLFLVFMIPAAAPLSFSMSPITNSDTVRFNFSGDAYIDGGIQITTNDRFKALDNRLGRATFMEPLHLWDNASGNLTDFSSNFSLIINSNGNWSYADGLAFFIAPLDSTLRNWSIGGGSLGLGNITTSSSPSDSFVAVEFDTFLNVFDPFYTSVQMPFPTVGININNMTSVNATRWENDVTKGFKNDAWIHYDAVSKMLVVEFTGNDGNTTQRGHLSYEVDLRDYLPEYVMVGFSAATGQWFEQNTIESWSFSSTLQLNQNQNQNQNRSSENEPHPQSPRGRNNKGLISGLSAGLSLLVLASGFAIFAVWRKSKYQGLEEDRVSDSSMDNEFGEGTGPRKFSYNELVAATDNFAEEQKLGEGGFGCVYRGFLAATNIDIAVKRVSKGSKQGRKEYAAEVKIISQLGHMNLVQLIGWCHQRAELLLVYEFMPNGSLDSHLFKLNSVLTWEMRHRIAQGLASALLYLHEELRQYVVHRDIKASNIMLDSNFNAKLGDFGLARLVDHDKDSQTTVPAGTIGYMAPEYPTTGRASKETDIYSFGIVLLEIACGRRPIVYKHPQNQIVLVEWVWSLYGDGHLLDAADPKLESSEHDARKIEQLMVVGLWCVHPDSGRRPSIRQVVQVLNFEAPLPSLPLAMPKAMYDTPRLVNVSGSSSNAPTTTTDSRSYGQATNSTTSSAASASDLLPK